MNCLLEILTKHERTQYHSSSQLFVRFPVSYFLSSCVCADFTESGMYCPPESQNRCNRQDRYDNKKLIFFFTNLLS